MSSNNPNSWEYHQVDHLFLLVGENPLPNYVAAKTLLNSNGKVYLVRSTGTTTLADRLQKKLSKELGKDSEGKERVYPVNLGASEADAEQIRNAIFNKAKNLSGKIGLNYTGGTKAMSVHGYQALIKLTQPSHNKPKPFFSYLDSRKLQMCCEDPVGGKIFPFNVGLKVQPSLELVFNLHNLKWKLDKPPSDATILSEVAKEFARFHADQELGRQWRDWCNKQLRCDENRQQNERRKEDWKENDSDFQKISLPLVVVKEKNSNISLSPKITDVLKKMDENLSDRINLNQVKAKDFDSLKQVCQWLDGIWLEHYVLSILQDKTFKETYHIHESKMSFHIEDPRKSRDLDQFEFDVAFLRGYQFFAISCTTIDSYCKQKLFEAHLRAQQLGGKEARVALVCCYDKPNWLEDEINFLNAQKKQSETQKEKYQKKVKVFGRDDLVNLSQEIGKWIEHNKGEEKGE